MVHISIKYHKYRTYTESPGCIVVGKGFYQGKLYEDNEFHTLISSWSTKEDFVKGIQELNGFYALISRQGGQLFAAVDRVRSSPLFYAQKANEFYLSDCADWVREQVGNTELDPIAKEEFLLTGYVTGSDTLFPNVKQIQAGECIFIEEIPEGINVKKHRYYQYIHSYPDSITEEELLNQHDEVLINIFNRLIEIAAGRTIVVPLSGGFDSRLIVLMLKRLGYDKVIAFSYGRPGNSESVVSKQIAENLGIRWEFVEYSNDLWYQWYHSKEYKRYESFAAQVTSVPHIQDWSAVWHLKENNKIPQDSIFVPGHSADLPAGSRSVSLPKIYEAGTINEAIILKSILSWHYSLFDWSDKAAKLSPVFNNRIMQVLGDITRLPDNACAFELWDVSQRQAKFIINSLRVYEFWNYDWWMPFWDYEYMNFWNGVPLTYRKQKYLYDTYISRIQRKYSSMVGRDEPKGLLLKDRIKSLVKQTPFENTARQIYARFSNKRQYQRHPLAWYGIVDEGYFRNFYTGRENINSLLAYLYLEEFKLKHNKTVTGG